MNVNDQEIHRISCLMISLELNTRLKFKRFYHKVPSLKENFLGKKKQTTERERSAEQEALIRDFYETNMGKKFQLVRWITNNMPTSTEIEKEVI